MARYEEKLDSTAPFPNLQKGDVILLSGKKWPYAHAPEGRVFKAVVIGRTVHARGVNYDCYLGQPNHLITVRNYWIDGVLKK